ncbi:hypothetical protein SAMN02745150_00512 [Brevinema andersonii]|uniref:Yip1 domain-containing protein n=1 Tax=Brevinema andersonii TaxID=34097 RepID=A0A1I1DLP2_BREAD|nr:hypothetical protein [Brevinema andersonii]SFB73998.1 hypothetical protein SAMN02745150_00512 [Brevinema andersonii]
MKNWWQFLSLSVGFFYAPKKTLNLLTDHFSHNLLLFGFITSLLSRFSFILAKMMQQGAQLYVVFIAMIPYYIASFICFSIILSFVALQGKIINFKEFWGLYFASDIVLLIFLPVVMIDMLFPQFSLDVIFHSIVAVWSGLIKLLVLQKAFNIGFSKTLVLSFLPIILVLSWGIATLITFFSQLSVYFG